MNSKRLATIGGLLASLLLTGSCASVNTLVATPQVSLRNVEVTDVALNRQSFVLAFDVTNPNPFPLPVSRVSYGVELDGHRFASGEARNRFTVPAGSDGAFAISVDLDLLNTAPDLLFIVRDASRRDIPYVLSGRFDVELPLAPAVEFDNSGLIRLQAYAH